MYRGFPDFSEEFFDKFFSQWRERKTEINGENER